MPLIFLAQVPWGNRSVIERRLESCLGSVELEKTKGCVLSG